MCMIYALGNVSGAHFNPAVTLAILLSGRHKISPSNAAVYMITQIVGGIAGAMIGAYMYRTQPSVVSMVSIGPADEYNLAQAGAAEVVATFVLCFVVLSV